ncbi:hypothetical protein BAU07_10710 [Bordetella flabilis]|uniref:Uncharacterized protein n=1 Tax=Bordetella flabilis TaxID=463014 RepID=A0A193GBX2_9BORD|nr:hypothetical protein BAU07_10710 [Bordetella flabilis]
MACSFAIEENLSPAIGNGHAYGVQRQRDHEGLPGMDGGNAVGIMRATPRYASVARATTR